MKWIWRGLAVLVGVLVIAFLILRTPDTDAAEMRAKYGGPPSQFVEIGDGVTVHLRDEGPRDGLPIVLLHGSNADLHTWQPWVDGLTETYRVIRFDQVGHASIAQGPKSRSVRAPPDQILRVITAAPIMPRISAKWPMRLASTGL